ncbi:hypothetical protein DL767_006085 [Monosporascus sp. MG133]|nr:hypothetical protein DL767_006085 [Monosporascus sp. MG133]
MATEFLMPRMLEQMQPRFYQHHYQYPSPQSHSPTSQAQSICQPQQIPPLSTSDNASPTASSPMSQNNLRMQPVYMPAVLRPNEYPSKPVPPKKPVDADQSSLQSNHSFLTLNGWGVLGRLTRRATVDSGKCLDDDDDDDDDAVQWNLDLFPKPTAQPTREHWKADPESTMCDEPSCMRRFNYWTRRHHCRKCGNIFCDWHSAYDVPLDQDANYNPRGTPSRACFHCFSAFKAWRSRTNSQASSDNSSVTNGSQSAPASPVVSGPTAKNMAQRQQHPSEIAMSVPRDWNWSTF